MKISQMDRDTEVNRFEVLYWLDNVFVCCVIYMKARNVNRLNFEMLGAVMDFIKTSLLSSVLLDF